MNTYQKAETPINKRSYRFISFLALALSTISVALIVKPTYAAEDLELRKGVSFVQDIDAGFPIVANKFDDVSTEHGKATLIFYGASGDLNTNRQAKRMVDVYKKMRNRPIKFILIDVDHPGSTKATELVKKHYKGYIPFQVILGSDEKVSWSQVGEIESNVLEAQINKVAPETR